MHDSCDPQPWPFWQSSTYTRFSECEITNCHDVDFGLDFHFLSLVFVVSFPHRDGLLNVPRPLDLYVSVQGVNGNCVVY